MDFSGGCNVDKIVAEAWDASAQCRLGSKPLFGDEVTEDDEWACQWLQKVGAAKNAAGQHNLAIAYDRGQNGIKRNDTKVYEF
jgi:TPR repeat protein